MLGWSVPRRIGRPGVVTSMRLGGEPRGRAPSRAAPSRARRGPPRSRPGRRWRRPRPAADPRPAARRSRAGSSVRRPFLPRTSSSSASRAATSARAAIDAERVVAQRLEVAGQVGEVHVSFVRVSGGSEPSSVCDQPSRARGDAAVEPIGPGSGALRELGDPGKRRRVADGQVGQDLAVDLDVGLLETGDELRRR